MVFLTICVKNRLKSIDLWLKEKLIPIFFFIDFFCFYVLIYARHELASASVFDSPNSVHQRVVNRLSLSDGSAHTPLQE